MANRIRGEVGFDVEDRGHFTLVYDYGALSEIEDSLDISIAEFSQMFAGKGKLRLKHVRAAFWAGLRHHTPAMSIEQVGDLIMALGGIAKAMELIGTAIERLSTPSVSDDDGGTEERPQTGRGSKVRGRDGAHTASTLSNSGDSLRAK